MPYTQTCEVKVRYAAERLAAKRPTRHRVIVEASSGARGASLDAQIQFLLFTLIAVALAQNNVDAAAELDSCRRELLGLEDTLRAAQRPLHRIGSIRQTHVTAAALLWTNVGFESARAYTKCEALQVLVAVLSKSQSVRVPCVL